MVLHGFFTIMCMSRPAYICLKEKSHHFQSLFLKKGSLGGGDRAMDDDPCQSYSLWRLVPGQVLGGKRASGAWQHSCAFESYQKCAPLKFKMHYSDQACSSGPIRPSQTWVYVNVKFNVFVIRIFFLLLNVLGIQQGRPIMAEFHITGVSLFN